MRANVLIVDDDAGLRRALDDRFKFWHHTVQAVADGAAALAAISRKSFDLVILDLNLPDMDGLAVLAAMRKQDCHATVIVLTAHGTIGRAVEAIKLGAVDFLTKPTDFDLMQRVVARALKDRQQDHAASAAAEQRPGLVRGRSPAMAGLLAMAERVAAAPSTVLVTGESGTGKQVLAEHIHAHSGRADGPFVYVNCVAISDELSGSTLFGHERGAFTGAVARKLGRLELAAGGTVFLDEIGDITPDLQTKLLHFLESGEFERVGGNQTVAVDCRIVAATNRDLVAAVKAGEFREDLYYRLNVIELKLPALRERPEDIPMLAGAFLTRLAAELKRAGLGFDHETLRVMSGYSWPGNIRQLRNAVERMAVLAEGPRLTVDLLPPEITREPDLETLPTQDITYKEAVVEFKRRFVGRALQRCGGNQTRAAVRLDLQRSYLNRLIRELGLGAKAAQVAPTADD
jgi:DNA-binding NtrC family response regulator